MGIEELILKLLKSPRGRVVVAFLLTITGVFWVWLLVPGAMASWQLAKQNQPALAQIIDSRMTRGLHYFDGSYDLRYRFQIPNSNHWYMQSDHTGRTELWSSLPKDEWEASVHRGTIDVIYQRDNPNNNDLARNESGLRRNAVLMIAWSVVWCGG